MGTGWIVDRSFILWVCQLICNLVAGISELLSLNICLDIRVISQQGPQGVIVLIIDRERFDGRAALALLLNVEGSSSV